MNGKLSKRLRRYIYGDMSLRNRTYITLGNGQIISDKLRHTYLQIKKAYKLNHNIWKGVLKGYDTN